MHIQSNGDDNGDYDGGGGGGGEVNSIFILSL